jgi:hypothetical protein
VRRRRLVFWLLPVRIPRCQDRDERDRQGSR